MSEPRTKRCSRCERTLPLTAFHKNRSRRDGVCTYCIECHSQYGRERYAKDPDRYFRQGQAYRASAHGREVSRRVYFKNKYGITLEQHKQRYIDQNGCCALCGKPMSYDRVYTDHDHETGKVRGLLCCSCNTGIGLLGDTFESVMQAAEYLGRF